MGEETEKEELKAKLQSLSSLVSSLKKKHSNELTKRYGWKSNTSSNDIHTARSSSKVWVRNTKPPQQQHQAVKMTNTAFSNVLTDNALSKTNIWRKTDTSHFRNTNDKSKDSTKLLAVKHSGSLDNNYEHYNKSRFKLERTPSSPKKPERHTQLQDNDYQHYNKSRFKLEKTSSSPKKPERHNEPQKNIYEHYSTSRFKLEKAPSSPKKPGTLLKKSLSEGNLVKTNSYQGNGSEVISSTNETSTLLFPSRHVWTSNSPSKLNSTEFNISMRQNSISKVGGKSYKQPSNFVSLTTECTASPGSSRLVWTNPLSTNSFFKPQKTVTSPLKQPEGTDTKSIKNANISKHVWKRNTADPSSSQKGETAVRSLKKHKWVKSTSKQMSLKPRKAKSFSGSSDRFSRSSVYSWSSIDSKGSSFLARRAKTVVKQSRFALVRSHGSSSESVRSPLIEIKPFATRYSYRRKYFGDSIAPSGKQRRQSFLRRRMHYVASTSHGSYRKPNMWNSSKQFTGISTKFAKTNVSSVRRKGSGGHDVSKGVFRIRGTKFQTDVKGRKLQRVLSSEHSKDGPVLQSVKQTLQSSEKKVLNRYKLVNRKENTLPKKEVTKALASRVLRKSVAQLHQTKLKNAKKKEYCMFYNRFGKCKNGKDCRYIHDPDKVAVCTRFLRGTCKNTDGTCLFSHKIDSEKMPTCSFFLRGMCHKDDCPYAHVKVSQAAKICEDFLKGHCPKGNECPKKHIRECEEFSLTGKCSLGKGCKLIHRIKTRKRKRSSSLTGTKVPKPFRKASKQNKMEQEGECVTDGSSSETLQIKPQFLMTEGSERFPGNYVRLKRKREGESATGTEKVSGIASNTQDSARSEDS